MKYHKDISIFAVFGACFFLPCETGGVYEVFLFQLLRWITSQIYALWQMCKEKTPPEGVDPGVPTEGEYAFMWRPWEHIYAINKVKVPNTPAYNPHGKYVVKLYWMVGQDNFLLFIFDYFSYQTCVVWEAWRFSRA